MRIVFVRHGNPDYENDCLTELGHTQAQAAAQRLRREKITKIYSSSCGRAVETAEHIASLLNLTIEKLDFMREIRWGSIDGEAIFENGHPWDTSDHMVAKGQSVLSDKWAEQEPFCRNEVIHSVQNVSHGFDAFLATLGYEREGLYYRVRRKNSNTVAMVSHSGSSGAAIAHLFNLSFPFVCAAIKPDFTSVTVVSLEGEEGGLVSPAFEILTDSRHIEGIAARNIFGQ